MASTYHPQVYRGSNVRSQASPASTTSTSTSSSNTATAPKSAGPQATARVPVRTTRSIHKPHSSLPVHGLSTNSAEYPLHPASSSALSFRTITAHQYAAMVYEHANIKHNERVLFPWMHGSDFPNTQQAANFGYVNGNTERVPRFRGLTTIQAPAAAPESKESSTVANPHTRNATSASIATSCSTDSFNSIATTSSSSSSLSSSASSVSSEDGNGEELESRASSIFGSSGSLSTSPSTTSNSSTSSNKETRGSEPTNCLLTSAWQPQEILDLSIPAFVKPVLPAGISFRHFRLQGPKYASISDVVIYCEKGGYAAEAVELARNAKVAMMECERERLERGDNQCLSYEIYVIVDPFCVFEQKYPHLVAVDSNYFAKNKTSFTEKEHAEMRDFTQASEIAENVWLGNTYNVPLPTASENGSDSLLASRRGSGSSVSSFSSAAATSRDASRSLNPHSFSICIEGRDQASMLSTRQLQERANWLDEVQSRRTVEAHQQEMARRSKANRSSFWYSSSSSSSSSESGPEEEEEDDDASDFDDFATAGENSDSDKENNGSRNGAIDFDPDQILSLSRQSSRKLSACSSSKVSSNGSTPIKLQYKKHSKSLKTAKAAHEAKVAATSMLGTAFWSTVKKNTAALQASADEIVHLECIATGQNYTAAHHHAAIVDAIIEHVMWIRTQARPHLRTSIEQRGPKAPTSGYTIAMKSQPRKVLMHCVDGYTDTSLLALAYIMYDRVCPLPDAYLYLQNRAERSFFVYPTDVALLGMLEKKIHYVAQMQGRNRYNDDLSQEQIQAIAVLDKEKERLAAVQAKQQQQQQQQQATLSALGTARSYLPRPSFLSRSSASSTSSTSSNSTMRSATPTSSTFGKSGPSTSAVSNAVSHPWFYNEKFDGHFPSRILDFLYLGNVNHATNALMLKELGITHVLSIGETALIPPHKQAASTSPSNAAKARTPTNSLWLEQSLGNITVCDIQDIQDDGCDTILPHLVTALEFIEAARLQGGKVLIHCRVGVSRSATLVIAYVMKYLDIPLVDAYLMVRARRLNILVQPTILFMWTLHSWEEEIRESAVDEQGRVAAERSARITWPVLATEIANLNHKYLGC